MIKVETSITEIKRKVLSFYKKDVMVRLNLGRNKFVTFPANVSGVYSSIFTVEPADRGFIGKTAYSYSEILCGKVFITPASGA